MSISALLLDPATKHDAVEEIVGERWDALQRTEYELCLGLRRLFRDNVHRRDGVSRFADWADRRFGIPGRLAGLFSFLGSHLERLPETRTALERGELGHAKVREFVKLATEEDEAEWLEYARTHTNRQLERRAERARRGTEHDTRTVVSRLTPREAQAARKTREFLTTNLGKAVPEDKLLATVTTELVERGLIEALRSGNGKAPTATGKRPRPYLSIHWCPRCTYAFVPTPGELLRVPVEEWFEAFKNGAEVHDFVKDLVCDCVGVKHRRDLCPEFRATEGEPPRSRHVPAAVWRRVEARDGFRCRTPGCGNPVPLQGGHIKPFRDGAPMLPPYLCQQCATCNELIEAGRLVVEGEAPYDRYYRDGEFIGYGFDPESRRGAPPEAPESGGTGPPEGRKQPA